MEHRDWQLPDSRALPGAPQQLPSTVSPPGCVGCSSLCPFFREGFMLGGLWLRSGAGASEKNQTPLPLPGGPPPSSDWCLSHSEAVAQVARRNALQLVGAGMPQALASAPTVPERVKGKWSFPEHQACIRGVPSCSLKAELESTGPPHL